MYLRVGENTLKQVKENIKAQIRSVARVFVLLAMKVDSLYHRESKQALSLYTCFRTLNLWILQSTGLAATATDGTAIEMGAARKDESMGARRVRSKVSCVKAVAWTTNTMIAILVCERILK
jgi:hypothetical protein